MIGTGRPVGLVAVVRLTAPPAALPRPDSKVFAAASGSAGGTSPDKSEGMAGDAPG